MTKKSKLYLALLPLLLMSLSVNVHAEPVVDKADDKLTVVALREIASGKLDVQNVRHEFIQSYKESPIADASEETLEIGTEDPMLREIDAELENTLVDETADAGEDVADDVAIDSPESDAE